MNINENKRKQAVALSYRANHDETPQVIAKGKGKIAENLIEKAQEHQVPIKEDPSLVHLLSELNLNQSIPEELYQAVAEVFAFIYNADKLANQRKNEG